MIFPRPTRRKTPHSPLGGELVRRWPRGFLATLLAVVLVQAIAVEAHLHFAPQASSWGAQVAQPAPRGSDDGAANCPLCQEAATAGAYLLPAAIVLPPAPAVFPWPAPAAVAEFALPAPARGWLSRAPPR